ncbi:MAG: glycosyltransferase [Candidatus Dormibacteria bacterium]
MTAHRLLLDLQASQSRAHAERGIARYVIDHAASLMRRSDRVRGLLLNPFHHFPGHLPAQLLDSPLLQWSSATGLGQLQADGPLAFHMMSPFELPDPSTAVASTHLLRPEMPLIVTLYDLIPYLMRERYLRDQAIAKRYLQRLELVRGADLVLAISEATRQDAISALDMSPDRVVNISGGISELFGPAAVGVDTLAAVRALIPAIRGPYVFTVGGAEWRKNTERLIEAYGSLPAGLRSRYQLVITCALPDEWRRTWLTHAAAAGCDDGQVVITGRVEDSTLLRLYQGTSLFIFPSLYEGFGLPVAEAIACGAPAITSSVSSLPEILEHPAATFHPEDVEGMAGLLQRGLEDEEFGSELRGVARRRAPLFHWDVVADRSLEGIALVIDETSPPSAHHSHRPRLRVALATPLPPEPNGVASYSARLIPHLAEQMDLDVLYPEQGVQPDFRCPGVNCLPIAGLGRYVNPYSYDAVIFAIGNHPVHAATYEAMQSFPGIVWFHDVRLPHLYWHHAQRYGIDPRQAIRNQLNRYYRGRAADDAAAQWSVTYADRFGLNLTTELSQRARHVIVHNPLAERMLRLDQGPDVRCPPVTLVPLAAASIGSEGPVSRVSPPVVGALGVLDERKSPTLLIDAIALIPAERRPHLIFVGPAEDWKRDWLLGHARDIGLGDGAVSVTGWVDDIAWHENIASLTCVVQLRAATNGESSASIRDALGSGVPVITNMLGAAEEFPEGSLVTLPPLLTSAALAAHIDTVCSDGAAWARLSAGGWAYSQSVTGEQVARQITAVVRATVGAANGSGEHR